MAPPNTLLTSPEEISLETRGDRNDGPKRTIEGERQHPNVADRENLEKDVPGYGSSLNLATPDFSTHLLIGPGDRSDTVRGWQSGESERGAPHSTLKGQRCLCHPSEPEDPETALAKECREDLHLILVFVGLLSAMITTLFTYAVPRLLPDNTEETNFLLQILVYQGNNNTGNPPVFVHQGPSMTLIASCVLLFICLVITLLSGMYAIYAKAQLDRYSSARVRMSPSGVFPPPGLETGARLSDNGKSWTRLRHVRNTVKLTFGLQAVTLLFLTPAVAIACFEFLYVPSSQGSYWSPYL